MPASASPSGWKIESTPNPAGAGGSELEGLSCASARACTAAGFYKNASGKYVTLAERWNGKKWTIESTPNPAGARRSELEGVSCASARACIAAGFYKNASGKYATLAERWNGKKWTIERTRNPARAKASGLVAVSCTAASACTAVGFYERTAHKSVALAERWNGKKWTIGRTSNPAGAAMISLGGVSCASARACTAVGSYINRARRIVALAERWNGKQWTIERTSNPAEADQISLDGVSCASARACTAVGSYQNRTGNQLSLAERWNGKKWTLEATPNPAGAGWTYLYGVSCTAAGACTAVGPYRNRAGKQLTLAERWNGKKWTIEATANPAGTTSTCFYGVSCTAAGACTAVGHYRNRAGRKVTLAEGHR